MVYSTKVSRQFGVPFTSVGVSWSIRDVERRWLSGFVAVRGLHARQRPPFDLTRITCSNVVQNLHTEMVWGRSRATVRETFPPPRCACRQTFTILYHFALPSGEPVHASSANLPAGEIGDCHVQPPASSHNHFSEFE